MFKYTVKYNDWNGVEKERDLYFNLTKTELTTLELSFPGGMYGILNNIVRAKDNVEIVKMLDLIIEKSFGIKSPDGESFAKGPEIYRAFKENAAYDVFFEWLTEDGGKNSITFVNSVIPQGVLEEAEKMEQEKINSQITPSGVTTPIN